MLITNRSEVMVIRRCLRYLCATLRIRKGYRYFGKNYYSRLLCDDGKYNHFAVLLWVFFFFVPSENRLVVSSFLLLFCFSTITCIHCSPGKLMTELWHISCRLVAAVVFAKYRVLLGEQGC